jgi:hypothetical protein
VAAAAGCGDDEDAGSFELTRPSGTVVVRDCDGERSVLKGTAEEELGCTVVDARKGAVTIVTVREGGGTQRARFNAGVFRVEQAQDGFTDVVLADSAERPCSSRERRERTVPEPDDARGTRRFRRLLADGTGRFRTRGSFASATVRGTKWGTQDFCHGTLVVVRQGRMAVRDPGRGRTVEVEAPGSYFARAG